MRAVRFKSSPYIYRTVVHIFHLNMCILKKNTCEAKGEVYICSLMVEATCPSGNY